MNVTSHKTLLYILFSFVFIFFSCSSNSRTYSKNKHRSKTHISKKHKRTNSSKTTVAKKSSKNTSTKENAIRKSIVTKASTFQGIPYVYGGKNTSGFDCSGFITYIYDHNGLEVRGNSSMQSKLGKRKSINNVKAGDLIFFGKGSKVSHVAIVSEKSKDTLEVIHSTSSRGVVKENIAQSKYWQAKILYAKDVISR